MLTWKCSRRLLSCSCWLILAACTHSAGDAAPTAGIVLPWSEHARWLAETKSQAAELEDRIDRLALRVVVEPAEPRRRIEASLAVLHAESAKANRELQHAAAVTEALWPSAQSAANLAMASLRLTLDSAQLGLSGRNPEETWRLLQRLPFDRREDYRQGTLAWLQSLERRIERLRHQPDGTGDLRAEVGAAVARLDVARRTVRERLATFTAVAEDDWDMWKAGLRVQVDHLRDEVAERSRQLLAGGMR